MSNSVIKKSYLFGLLLVGLLVWVIALLMLLFSSYFALHLLNSVVDLAQLG
jgi:hypothetical protein